jgi:hypothetical protein
LVGISIDNLVDTARPQNIQQATTNTRLVKVQSGIFSWTTLNKTAFHVSSDITLTGGGPDRNLGVDRITTLFSHNFKSDTFQGNYAAGRTLKEVFVCDPTVSSPITNGAPALMSFPVMDNASFGYPSGGPEISAAADHQETIVGGDIRKRKIEWMDSPAFVVSGLHPCTNVALMSTSGYNDFIAPMLSYSEQATHALVINAQADWKITIAGSVATNAWTKGAATGIGSSTSTAGKPTEASGAGIMLYGPTAVGGDCLKMDGR